MNNLRIRFFVINKLNIRCVLAISICMSVTLSFFVYKSKLIIKLIKLSNCSLHIIHVILLCRPAYLIDGLFM